MLMRKLVKLLTKITVVRPGDTIMLAMDIRSVSDIERIEHALKLKEWSASTGIKYVIYPGDVTMSVVRKEGP